MHLTRSLRAYACVGGLLLAVLALSAGCASKGPKPTLATGADADKYLFDQGTESLKKHRWLRAREYFRQIVDNYPQSRYRPDAKLGLGDTYLGEDSVESLILGANEFREFLTYFPTHERADYAQYKLALSHYEQMLAPQRDQSQTKEATREFQTFVERFPESKLINEGQKKLQECRDRMSDADYQVGVFYYRSRWYPGAIVRLRTVMKENPQFGKRDALYYFLADTYVKVNASAEALPLLDKLVKEFERSEYLVRANKLMADIKNGTATPIVKPAPANKKEKKKDATS
ncbi:MAG TPA: outer membrane protein assembly factor BamD [Vicinamibacterales bacterium]